MTVIELVGWLGNGCFFVRFLIQWIQSEKTGVSASPPSFWKISLLGYLLLGAYTWHQEEYVLVAGCVINSLIATRNLGFGEGGRLPGPATAAIAGVAFVVSVLGAVAILPEGRSVPWIACVAAGQILFGARFIVQWMASERRGMSYFPRSFWWFSLAGNSLLLAYAIHRQDLVLIAGYAVGPIVQVRNLMLETEPASSQSS